MKEVMKKTWKEKHKIQHWHMIALYMSIYDAIAINLSYLFVLWLRFDARFSQIPKEYLAAWVKFVPLYTVFCITVFWWLRLYKSIWRFASYSELARVAAATLITTSFHVAGITILFQRMPAFYYIISPILQFLLVLGVRFSYRFVLLERKKSRKAQEESRAKRLMVIGAGQAGQILVRELQKSKELNNKVCCIIDDNPNKWGRYIDGIPIIGGREKILFGVEQYQIEKICVAIPSASKEERRKILNICKEAGCELKSLPGIYQLVKGETSFGKLQDVDVEELLERDPIRVNMEEIFQYLRGKVILVTGGGGSIGSELCRQIAKHQPKQLIIFDIYENSAYAIQQELKREHPELNLEVIIGSVRDSRKIFDVFKEFRPQIVYHAAAHKHVPLMEDSPCEAIKNNVIGTYKTAYAAIANGTERFVLISTDKAVNPTNVMGASKRACEKIIHCFDQKIKEGKTENIPQLFTHRMMNYVTKEKVQQCVRAAKTEFVAVRFGNVLGSNGSVIPLFKKQIAEGGPVTVTHPDIIRYFMTIPEAVSLVLQAGTYAKGGEIFVLDMGSPVKIDTLARNLIKLSGLRPDIDIKVEYTGLRPGEKLYEEKLMAEEGLSKTANDLIHVGKPVLFDADEFLEQLNTLMKAAYENRKDIREQLQKMIPTYHPAGREGQTEKDAVYEQMVKEVAVARAE
jgi:FlaA1/EpsC-like NDP-sugar epimerase